MKLTYQKEYTWAGIHYIVKCRQGTAMKDRAILELWQPGCFAPLFSDIQPLSNMEKLADAFFAYYKAEASK